MSDSISRGTAVSIDAFVQSGIVVQRRERADGAPDPARCLRVARVAPAGPLASLGVRAGDLLVSIDGKDAGGFDAAMSTLSAATHAYRAYLAADRETLHLETALPLGAQLVPTPEAIEASYSFPEDPDRLAALWEAGEWARLDRLATRELTKRSGGVVKAITRLAGSEARRTPAVVLLGAALYELGRHQEGLALVEEYASEYEKYYTTNFYAIARYVLGKEAIRKGDREEGLQLLRAAFDYDGDSERIAGTLEQLSGQRPQPDREVLGNRFPIGYRLPLLGGMGEASLERSLAGMGPGRILVVCTLASYRANGPYSEFMRRHVRFEATIGARIHELHVITSTDSEKEIGDWWLNGEKEARKAGVRFSLLYDEQDMISEELLSLRSPWVYALTRDGTVVHEGTMDDLGLWEALAAAAKEASAGAALPMAPRLPAATEAEIEAGGTPPMGLLGCASIVAATIGGGAGGWFLWRWVGTIGGAVVAALLALMIYGFMTPPGPDEKK